jgi:hypothetical protein
MSPGDLSFAVLAINPIGGLAIAIPFAVFGLHHPAWLAWVVGLPLAYVQVLAVDLLWTQLVKLRGLSGFLERRRSPKVERLVASRGSFWLTMLLSPFIGPWLVMAFMRFAQVPHRKVALPLFLGLAWNSGAVAAACAWLPQLVHHAPVR